MDNENETNICRGLDVIQSMIDISADRLERLRTQCATGAELTQREIRILEAKLTKMFTELLLTKVKLAERLPRGFAATDAELKQWLRVVGLSPECMYVLIESVSTLELLLDKNDIELRFLFNNNVNVREEETLRLVRATLNLKRCRESVKLGEKEPVDLYWDSWDGHQNVRSSAPEIYVPERSTISPEELTNLCATSVASSINNNKQKAVKGFPTTTLPSPYVRHQTYLGQSHPATSTAETWSNQNVNGQQQQNQYEQTTENTIVSKNQQQQQQPESVRCNSNSNATQTITQAKPKLRSRLNSEPTSDNFDKSIDIPAPRSPIMGHTIAHRFIKKFKVGACDLCHKQMVYGLRCKDCKYLCHKDCENCVPPSCCLPRELIDEFKKTLPSDIFLSGNNSLTLYRTKAFDRQTNVSSPGSSFNSSSSSSPPPASLNQPVPHTPATSKHTQFDFSDVAATSSTLTCVQEVSSPRIEMYTRKPLLPTEIDTSSDRTQLRVDSLEENEEFDCARVSLKEWDIPFGDLEIMEKIGDGRFGTVHSAQWHGPVAVKLLKRNCLDNEAFTLEVATFKKTRHENVVLFMGACIKPQAIVTSLCRGNTLYTHIRERRDKFNLNKTTMVAQQISQGMGYLHARDIVHYDLKTKNIFLENGKVIITDFGSFNATKLNYNDHYGLEIPSGWLCYLAPELIRVLQPCRTDKDDVPFSKASDIYAFGTVLYELLCGEFPFKSQAAEAIIFQVGRGMKQTLANLQASRDVKDILMTCWASEPGNRPDFTKLLTLLEGLLKKRLARSPSNAVLLSRSAESVF